MRCAGTEQYVDRYRGLCKHLADFVLGKVLAVAMKLARFAVYQGFWSEKEKYLI